MDKKYKYGLIPSILIHLGLGGIYSWSQMTNKIAYELGVDESLIHWVFVPLALIMGLSALFSNLISSRIGVRNSITLGALLYSIGMALSIISINNSSLPLLILGYGVISSMGMGLCYLIPIKNVMLWFPKSSGLSIGLTIFSFNISGLISSAIVYGLYEYKSSVIFTALFVLGLIPIAIGASLIKKPVFSNIIKEPKKKGDLVRIMTDGKFGIIWVILCMKLSAGLMIFYNIISIVNYNFTAFSYNESMGIILSSAILCGLGKLSIPWISDKISGNKLKINYFIFGFPLLAMVSTYFYHSWEVIPILLLVSSFMYGAGLSSIPVILKECYGFRYLGTIQCIMFTSWCVAGFLGAKLGSEILDHIGLNYLLSAATIMYIIGFILSSILIHKVNKERVR